VAKADRQVVMSYIGVTSKWQVYKVMHLLLLDYALFCPADSCMELPLTFVARRWKFYPEIIIAAKKGRYIQNFNLQVDVVTAKQFLFGIYPTSSFELAAYDLRSADVDELIYILQLMNEWYEQGYFVEPVPSFSFIKLFGTPSILKK
jgi:hypothetical protein